MRIRNLLIAFAIGLLIPTIGHTQKLTFGPMVGNLWQGEVGNGMVDSIAFRVQPGRDNLFTFGVFADYQVLPNISVRGVVQYFDNGGVFQIANTLESCALCPIRQTVISDYQTIKVSITPRLEFPTPWMWLKPYLVGGAGVMYNHIGEQSDGFQGVDFVSPQTIEVGRLIQQSSPKLAFHSVLGLGVDVWNFTLSGHFTRSFGMQYYGPIIYDGQVHRFNSNVGYTSLMLGYKFKIKDKETE